MSRRCGLLVLLLVCSASLARAHVVSPLTGRMRPARVVVGTYNLRGINPAGVSRLNNNCLKAAIATDLNAKGIPAIALPQVLPSSNLELAALYGMPRYLRTGLEVAVVAHLEGPGYMGIITADVAGQPGLGHAFNVQNIAGRVAFIDGQLGSEVTDLSRYFNFHLFDTR